MDLFHDIETVPGQGLDIKQTIADEMEHEISLLRAPGNYKDQEKIAQYLASEAEKILAEGDARYRKTALSGMLGEVLCVAWAAEDKPVSGVFRRLDEPETALLDTVFRHLREDIAAGDGGAFGVRWVGHNCRDFDLRFLFQRAVILGINPGFALPHNARPGSEHIYDTMTEWAGWGNRVKLDAICRALGIPGKADGGMDGSQVYDQALAGNYDKILAYCKGDVERVRMAFRCMHFQEVAA